MTQTDALLMLLRHGPKTTNEIIQAPYGLASEYRRCISNLRNRKRGFVITYHHPAKGQGHGGGWYSLDHDPEKVQEKQVETQLEWTQESMKAAS